MLFIVKKQTIYINMIINTGQRTDIPAFFSKWFYNRVAEGFVYVRNPYFPKQITEYVLNPDVVDCLAFCTKNPEPMLARLNEISHFNQFWFVTITPYSKDIEPNVPNIDNVITSFRNLALRVGVNNIHWRFDPIFLNNTYTMEKHLEFFEYIASQLEGFTEYCIISFIDLYNSTIRYMPKIKEVNLNNQLYLGTKMVKIASKYKIKIKSCMENSILKNIGIDISGCLTKAVYEKATKLDFKIPKVPQIRESCSCIFGNDIGVYNTCFHKCQYCYANSNIKEIEKNYKNHDPLSPLLIGNLKQNEVIRKAKQNKFATGQQLLF